MKIFFIFVTATVLYVSAIKTTKPEYHASIKVNSTKLSAIGDDKRGKRTLSNFGNGFTYQNYYDRNLGQGYSTSRSYNPYDGNHYNTAISGSPHHSSNFLTSGHGHLQIPYHPYLNQPEPIIEIIIKDSNDTVVHPPQPIIPKKKKDKVHVYYVKYKKGEDNKLHLDEPIASINNDDEKLDIDEKDIVDYSSLVTPLPPIKPTTLRTVIHPDSEKFHSSNPQVHVTFGSESKSKIGHRIEEHNAESIRQSVVAVPIKSSYQKTQSNYNEPPKYQQLPQIKSRSSFQISSGPIRPHFDHYQQLPQQQTHVNFRPHASQQQPIQQFSQTIYQSQPFNQHQYNAKPFFGSSFHHQHKESQREQFLPTPPSSQLLPFLNNIQQNQQFFRPFFQQSSNPQQYQSPPPPPLEEQQLHHHQPQPIPLNTEFVSPKETRQQQQQEQYFPSPPSVPSQYHQNQQFQPQLIHVQSHSQQSQPQSVHVQTQSSQSQSQSQAQLQYQTHSSKNEAQFHRPSSQQHQTSPQPQTSQQHQTYPQHQNFNYQPNQNQYKEYYQSNYQENKPLAVQPLQKRPSEPQYNQHPASDTITALNSKLNIQPSKQTELLKAIPKYEQHITETVNITPNYDHTYSQTINGNYSDSQGHFITAGSHQANKEITNYVTTPKVYVPQPSSQRPQYVHSQNGEHIQIVTPMPSTSIYNLQQQQSLLASGKSSSLIPNSQSKLGYSSPYSVSTLYSDAFQELEKRKNQYSALLKGFDRNLPNYSSNQSPLSAVPSSTPTSKPKIELPDEVPDDLRQQLFSSGILNNADISVLDYDKVGDTALENLPQEHLQHFYGAGGGAQISESNKVFNVVKPNGDSVDISKKDVEEIEETGQIPKKNVELKVVRLDSDSKRIVTKYVKEDASVLPVVDLSSEKIYNKYLPVKVDGAQFPVPDVEELQGKIISNVVVLAPVDSFQSSESDEREERDTSNGLKLSESGDNLKELVKKPTRENFKKWLGFEAKQNVEQQSVVLLVLKNSSGEREIYLYDIPNDSVNKLSGELSTAFVNVAEENASTGNLDNASLHAEENIEEKDQSQK